MCKDPTVPLAEVLDKLPYSGQIAQVDGQQTLSRRQVLRQGTLLNNKPREHLLVAALTPQLCIGHHGRR